MRLQSKGQILLAILSILLSHGSFSFASQWVNPREQFKYPDEVRLQRGKKELTKIEKKEIKKYRVTGLEVMTYCFFNQEPGEHDEAACGNIYNYIPGQGILKIVIIHKNIYLYKSKAALVKLEGIKPGDVMRR
ncbi:MAG: hypothetical protein SV062_03200 [Thermodesulfobacteriota bacterium]|nr:hypothetical protein [Thermodesulfobacteriota bacterium]